VGLGITEAGNFPAAIKAVSEWFPKKERAFATGVLNAGTNAGAIIAPLIVPFIALAYGWRGAFLIVGATGLIWLFFWYRYYDTPARQKRLSRQELDYIQSDADREPEEADATSVSWRKLLSLRQTWAFGTGKFMTDGIWWFYLFWLPDFLKEQYGLSKTGLSAPVAVVYLIAIAGSLLGGWLPLRLANLGWPVSRARRTSMFIYACCATPVVAAQALGEYNMWFSVLMIGLATAAHQAWSANIFTTVSDMFPRRTVGFVTGFGGLTGTLGAVIIAKSAGYLFDYYKGLGHIQTGYFIMFVISGSAYLCAWFVMRLLVPEIKKADL
jgi:ACS family hexuronate transporter-like MFS transporter